MLANGGLITRLGRELRVTVDFFTSWRYHLLPKQKKNAHNTLNGTVRIKKVLSFRNRDVGIGFQLVVPQFQLRQQVAVTSSSISVPKVLPRRFVESVTEHPSLKTNVK